MLYQNLLKLNLKKSQVCPILGQSSLLWCIPDLTAVLQREKPMGKQERHCKHSLFPAKCVPFHWKNVIYYSIIFRCLFNVKRHLLFVILN